MGDLALDNALVDMYANMQPFWYDEQRDGIFHFYDEQLEDAWMLDAQRTRKLLMDFRSNIVEMYNTRYVRYQNDEILESEGNLLDIMLLTSIPNCMFRFWIDGHIIKREKVLNSQLLTSLLKATYVKLKEMAMWIKVLFKGVYTPLSRTYERNTRISSKRIGMKNGILYKQRP
ncbi:hypothetical protein ACJX0J_028490 [Zea mays]